MRAVMGHPAELRLEGHAAARVYSARWRSPELGQTSSDVFMATTGALEDLLRLVGTRRVVETEGKRVTWELEEVRVVLSHVWIPAS